MALPANRYRPSAVVPIEDDGLDLENSNGLADAYRLGWMGQLVDAFQRMPGNMPVTPGYDARAAIPEGYEEYGDAFMAATSAAGTGVIRDQIDRNLAARGREAKRGFWPTLGYNAVAGILDPATAVGAPVLKGAGLLAGAAKGAIGIGGVGALEAGLAGGLDATATAEEVAFGVGGSLLLGGVIGGVAGSFGRAVKPSTFAMPAKGRVTSQFGSRAAPKAGASTLHQGVDIAMPIGSAVQAPEAGKVVAVSSGGKGGVTVTIDHGDGIVTKYMHLSETGAKVGDPIRRGQRFAASGNTGNSTGPHLHYQMTVNGKAVDPLHTLDPRAETRAPADPASTVTALSGLEVPRTVDIDGRGVPVVVGPIPGGGMARFVRGKSIDEITREEARASTVEARAFDDDGGDAAHAAQLAEQLGRGDAPPVPDVGGPGPGMRMQTVNRYNKRGKIISSYEIEVPVREQVPRDLGAEADNKVGGPGMAPDAAERFAARLEARAEGLEDAAAARVAEGKGKLRIARKVTKLPGGGTSSEDWVEASVLAKELRARAADARLEVTNMERRAVMDPDGNPIMVQTEGPPVRDAAPDEMLAQQREADNAAWRDGLYGDNPKDRATDNLPFGMGHAGDAGRVEDGDHLAFDMEAIEAGFAAKVWMRPIEGVDALPEDAFRTIDEWINFVERHEVEHTVNPRLPDETLAQYENRINQRALEEVRAGNGSFSASRTRLEALAIAPTPMGQVGRLVADAGAEIHQSLQDLAGDFGVMLARNHTGGASTAGGSVFQRALRWQAELYPVRTAVRAAYLESLGLTSTGGRLQTEAQIVAQRLPFVGAAAKGRQTITEFRAEVGRAIVGFTDVSPHALKAAEAFNKVMQNVEVEARSLGLFQSQQGQARIAAKLQRKLDIIDQRAARLAELIGPEDYAEIMAIGTRLRGEIEVATSRAAEPVMPFRETNYYRRIYNKGALEADKPGAIAALTHAYQREGYSPTSADAAARGAYDLMTQDPGGALVAGSPSALKHRTVPWTDKEAFPYLVQDPELLMAVYLRRMGSAIEMTRRYGDAFGLDEADMLRADMIERGVPRDAREQALQVWEDARDRIAGNFHGRDPMSWDNRTVRALKNVANLAVMGKVLLSQVSDIAHTIGVEGLGTRRVLTGQGPAGLIGGVYAAIVGDLSRYSPGGLAKLSGEALELVSARATAHMIESDDALLVTSGSRLERGIASAQTPFFTANGMIPFTVLLKEWVGVVAGHNIIDEAKTVAAAIRAGAEPDAGMVKRLAQNGIDRTDAQLLADMPTETGKSGLHLANVMAWEGERGQRGRDLLLAAVSGEVRRAVVTPGPLDRPAIMDGVFHTKKGREAGLEEVRRTTEIREDAREALRGVARLDDDDPAKIAALDAYRAAAGEVTQARKLVGQRGRLEAPIASLPFQMHSFAMAAGGKVLHGLLSGADRNRVGGIVSLLSAGAIATWLKAGDNFDQMGWDEFAVGAFDNSSIGAWFGDIAKSVDTVTDAQFIPGAERDEKGSSISDEVGAAGVVPGLAAGLIEAFVSDDMPWDSRVSAVRRTLPFNNLIWWKGAVDRLQDQFEDGDGGSATAGGFAATRALPSGLLSDEADDWPLDRPLSRPIDDGGASAIVDLPPTVTPPRVRAAPPKKPARSTKPALL